MHNTGSSLKVFYNRPLEAFKLLVKQGHLKNVYVNEDYEPDAISRDKEIKDFLQEQGIGFKTYKDQCIFAKNEIVKNDGKPYTIFTPYSNTWKKKLNPFFYRPYPTSKYFSNLAKVSAVPLPSLGSIGFKKTDILLPKKITVSDLVLQNYQAQRNTPGVDGTSKLSIHLRFGTVGVRQLVAKTLPLSATWLNELIWRDFYMMILWQFPHVAQGAFKKEYNLINWRNNEEEFEKWQKGETGFPLVDAGMRELNTTGFMHNRVRMVVSSFLVKDLLIDWRWGEAYFAKKLNDFDLSANNGGWQWAAGSGCDAAPYFRIFNPTEQQKKFDPSFIYIKKWVPEFNTPAYPRPIVDHASARLRTLAEFKRTLTEHKQFSMF